MKQQEIWGGHLSDRIGYRIVKGEEIISQCISVFIGGGQAETDICTCEGYRRKALPWPAPLHLLMNALAKD